MKESNNINWAKLPFDYMKTNYNVRCYNRDGKWGELEVSSSEYINIHISATALHYGQQAFEGLKAFKGKDGKIRLFRWQENAKRLQSSADGILMPKVSEELFFEACKKAIKLNEEFVPPFGSGASLYLRPLLFGSGATIGVKPSNEYLFIVFVSPVGPYFKTGFNPIDMAITRDYDRAAPMGTGNIKVGGNYAASLRAIEAAHNKGYKNVVFLDAREKKYIDECGPANFFAIKGNTYITPKSNSILPSITNKCLIQLAESMGLKTERRPVLLEELNEFDEVGACGTAAVISPIKQIHDTENSKVYNFSNDGKAGPISTKLYEELLAIQTGEAEDKFGWISFVD